MFQSNKQHAELARQCNYICRVNLTTIFFFPQIAIATLELLKKNWSSYHTAYPIFTSVWVFQNWILITYFFGYLNVLLQCWSWQLFFKVSHTFSKKCCTNMLLSKLIQCNFASITLLEKVVGRIMLLTSNLQLSISLKNKKVYASVLLQLSLPLPFLSGGFYSIPKINK